MRQTYTSLQNIFLDYTGNTGTTDTTVTNFFQRAVNTRYQLVLAEMDNWVSQGQLTASTVVNQQFYHNPVGIVNIETATVKVGSISYPLTTVDSQLNWDRINETLITTTAIPQFIFPRRDDFGIWPIPQGIYTITLNYSLRDRNLTVADYVTGTATVTNNSQTLLGIGTSFSALMINRWFQFTNDGYWYRISGFTDATHLTLETSYEGSTAASGAYTIGQSPEIPEEGHEILAAGAAADYYMGLRSDIQKGNFFNNIFYTGDGNNNDRTGRNIVGGLIGLRKRYAERSNSKIVTHQPQKRAGNTKLWATKIS